MRLDAYLFNKGYTNSRTKAKEIVESRRVIVDGKTSEKVSLDVSDENRIEVVENDRYDFVGRGGIKLEAAMVRFGIDTCGKRCVDIGASTGGFTECLLKHGAALVYAVDSGNDQLAAKLRDDERVVSIEGFNARELDVCDIGGSKAEIVVMDVSFISQKLLYPTIQRVAEVNADIVTLIKPQFEAGRENVGKKGIVKDEKVRLRVIEDIKREAELAGFEVKEIMDSPITGGSGNKEYIMHAVNKRNS